MKLLRIGCPQNCPYRKHETGLGYFCAYPNPYVAPTLCSDPVDFRNDCPLEDIEE